MTVASWVKIHGKKFSTDAPSRPPTAPTPAAQAIARRTNSRAFGLDPSRMNGGSLVEVAAAIGSAHKAKNAKTVIQILYAAIIGNGCVLFTKPDMHAYIDRTHTTMKETGRNIENTGFASEKDGRKSIELGSGRCPFRRINRKYAQKLVVCAATVAQAAPDAPHGMTAQSSQSKQTFKRADK